MSAQTEAIYSFVVEWFDNQASLVRTFQLRYFPGEEQIEMFDVKNKRIFLKKCHYPSISIKDLYPGAQISVYARTLKVIDYADVLTKNVLSSSKESVIVYVKPSSMYDYIDLFSILRDLNISVCNAKLCELLPEQINTLRIPGMFTGNTLVIHAIGPDAYSALEQAFQQGKLGRSAYVANPIEVKSQLPLLFVTKEVEPVNAGHALQRAKKAALPAVTCVGRDCTVVVIKPHAVLAGATAGILTDLVKQGVEITSLSTIHFDRACANEFLAVYRGVVSEFNGLVDHLATGPSIALELQHAPTSQYKASSIVPHVRQICGPSDPAIAQALRPNTIRAKHGLDKVKNAVHCTDLLDDGVLESEFLFRIIQ